MTAAEYMANARASVEHLVDLKRAGHSPRRTELRVCGKSDRIIRNRPDVLCEVTKRKPGGANNPHGRAGKPDGEEINVDNIHSDLSERPTGTSAAAGMRKLQKHAAEGLLS